MNTFESIRFIEKLEHRDGECLDPDDLRRFVAAHELEVIYTLYWIAAERWGKSHIDTAVAEAERQTLKAKVEALSVCLERAKARIEREAGKDADSPSNGERVAL